MSEGANDNDNVDNMKSEPACLWITLQTFLPLDSPIQLSSNNNCSFQSRRYNDTVDNRINPSRRHSNRSDRDILWFSCVEEAGLNFCLTTHYLLVNTSQPQYFQNLVSNTSYINHHDNIFLLSLPLPRHHQSDPPRLRLRALLFHHTWILPPHLRLFNLW